MKDNKLYEKCKSILESDDRFYYRGRGANLGVYSTSENQEVGFINFTKNLARKGYGAVTITFFEESKEGLEIKLDVYLPSYCEENTFFEGFLESIEDFNSVLRMLGIK
jgi:hypothetical protein